MKSRSLAAVAGPIWLENALRASITTVDVFMLSFYSEKAVAAVGLVNQFVFFIQLMYLMVASGASILLSQYVGAGQRTDARDTAMASLILGGAFALALSLALVLAAPLIVGLYSVDPVVSTYATQFLTIYAAGSVFTAFSMLQGTILRTHGRNRAVMFVNMGANVANVLGNALVLFGPFGFPVLGVPGVALSTVFSLLLACLALAWLIERDEDTRLDWSRALRVPVRVYRQILSVGVPTAGEGLSYNLAQIVNMTFIAGFGTHAMAAFVYLNSLQRYVFMTSASVGNATGIKVGWWVGAGQVDTAARQAFRYAFLALALATGGIVVLNLVRPWVFPLLTQNPEVLALIASMLVISIAQEMGRTFNLVLIPALKGAGDVLFPVSMGIVFMWGVGVLGSWVFGVALGWGLVGVWLSLALDECVRGGLMIWRWRSGRWRGKAFVDAPAAVELRAVTPGANED